MMLSNLALDASSAPTLFELSMASGLAASLKPAFDYTLDVFANRGHEWALFAGTKQVELFALLMFTVEKHYLGEYESSFAENFYGLKRTAADGKALTPRNKLTSLLELVLVPYVRAKLDQKNIPWVKHVWAMYELGALVFQFAYLFGKTKFFTPLLRAQGVCIARLTGDDMKKFNERAASTSVTWKTNKIKFLSQGLTSGIRYAVIFSVVILKLLDYYSSPENRAAREAQQRRFNPSMAPPPPMPPVLLPEAGQLVADPRLCPLCGEPRTNPALSSSGYCFCFKCIHSYVEKHMRCPVTGVRCTPLEIRKVFAT